jgi:class 3 adenylate cyclase
MSSDSLSHDSEMASVLFVDIVGFSLNSIDRQTALLSLLQRIVKESAALVLAQSKDELIMLPTGDGMALVFLRNAVLAAKCALEIAASLRHYPEIILRMGVHIGPVCRHADIKEEVNVVGGGINTAQRIMDCGDAGHILVSHSVAEVLEQFTGWRECLQDLGVHRVKHRVRVHLYNVCKDGVGNRETPRKLEKISRWKWLVAGSIAVVLATGGLILQREYGIFHSGATLAKPSGPSIETPISGISVAVADSLPFYITLDADVPADGSAGQSLSFTVRDGLETGGAAVIARGAKVSGSIVVGKKILGIWSRKMNFRLMQADAVDGQKLNVRATAGHADKGPASRPFDTGKGYRSKELAAAKGAEYIAYTDGEQTVSVRK